MKKLLNELQEHSAASFEFVVAYVAAFDAKNSISRSTAGKQDSFMDLWSIKRQRQKPQSAY